MSEPVFPPEAKLPADAILYTEAGNVADTGRTRSGIAYAVNTMFPVRDPDEAKQLKHWCQIPCSQVWESRGYVFVRTLLDGFTADEEQYAKLARHIFEWQKSQIVHVNLGTLPVRHSLGYGWILNAQLVHEADGALTPDDLPGYSPESPYFKTYTDKELCEGDFTIRWLIDGVLVEGQPLIVGGPIKVLKTSIIVDLAISLASGKKFLGRFIVNRTARVMIMSGESGMPVLKETANRVRRSKDIEGWLDNLHWSEELPQLDDPGSIERLVRTLKRDHIEVLAVDPAYLCFGGSEHGNIVEQGKKFKIINEACKRAGVQLILAHHFTKSAGRDYKPPQLSDLAQSGFDAYARSWILLKRRSPYKKDGHHSIWFDVGGSAGHSDLFHLDIDEGKYTDPEGRIWDVEIVHPESRHAEQVTQYEEEREAIEALLAGTEGLSVNAIAEGTETSRRRLEAILAAMVSDGTVKAGKVPHKQSKKKKIDGYILNRKREKAA